ncbi:serine/threonine-protein kinase RIO3 isoform X2 [Anoplophora glabripennis]|uniref:serine/threonine-protein kinase RIO3 isoform X2 n=1 Tax=Anoplophora glabripennis TaxID=217634 RepID=UPI000874B42E|nr:serine/threonine-protein kinase RIO3 isoform X2 [Anoplophora glabripennis]
MCAWANVDRPEAVNFADIVSEEISRYLQAKKENSIIDVSKDGWIWVNSHECDAPKCIEENINGTSTLSDSNNEKNSLITDSENDLEKNEIKYVRDRDSCDIFDLLESELTLNSKDLCADKLQSSEEVINKYDIVLRGKKDDSKLSSSFYNFRTEDGKVLDFKSSYRFFNRLKIQIPEHELISAEFRNRYKEDVRVMDPYTHILLYNMVVSRLLKSVDCVINASTEGVILLGTLDPSYQHATKNWPKRCAIKVFKRVSKCQQGLCYLYKEGLVNEAKTVQWWAQKSMDNLVRVRQVGISCPEVIKLKRHILVMSYIGTDKKPAFKLKYAALYYPDFVKAYEQVKNAMKILYQKANLIHGDMSEHNILWHDGQCHFIDFSHSVSPSHDYGFYFLHCDCVNITNFFEKHIPDIESAEELFIDITGFFYGDKLLLQKMQQLYKKNPNILHSPTKELTDGFDKTDGILLEDKIEE